MDYSILVKVDTNDADYIESMNKISEEDLDKIKPLIEAIKNFKPYKGVSVKYNTEWTHNHNFPSGEYSPREDLGEKSTRELYPGFDDEVWEIFSEILPYGEYGFHTIESIIIYPYSEGIKLL